MATTLGKSLRADKVGQLRLREVCGAPPGESIAQVVRRMTDRRNSCVLVKDGVRLLGIFTERDFLDRVIAVGLDAGMPIETVMTPAPRTVSKTDTVYAAVELMEQGGYRHLPVLDDTGEPVGVVSVKDIVHYLVEYFPAKVYNLPPAPAVGGRAREGA